jgi:hypothetical protein
MANLTNTRRWLVEGGEPLALGFVAVRDSLMHTIRSSAAVARTPGLQPSRSPAAWMRTATTSVLSRSPTTPASARHRPWYELQVVQDKDAIEVAEAQQRGEDPSHDPPRRERGREGFMRSLVKDGLLPGLREDLVLLRVLLRTIHLLDPPGDMMKNPVVLQRVLDSYARRVGA